ncbi:hypothetical protein RI129_002625 [Pyrocoelia pectoralis]|uniref:Transketolase-like pyrimidine-binding domain-containing protein n=1 Tax=Pyrocoelia pectoralis TaxID=417401 RepID=A0AAN7VNB6_9COLE
MYLNLYRLHAKQLQFVKHLKQYKFRNYHSDGVFGYRKKIETKYNLPEDVVQQRFQESNFYRLVTAYRQFGHLIADVNPVSFNPPLSEKQELTPNRYGLSLSDKISFKGIIHNGQNEGTVAEAIEFLKHVYGNHISAEFLHLETEEEIEWFSKRIEELHHEVLSKDERIDLASELLKCQTFDHFLANKFPGLKRYGGEGAESMMGFFSEVFHTSAEDSLEQIVIGMPHRGRLNFLTGMLHFQPAKMFVKLKGLPDFPTKFKATGDVVSHCISSTELMINNKPLHVTVLYNPSHLEVVNPVSMGKTRAKQMSVQDGNYSSSRRWSDKILNIQVHGDAAFAGQGINQECLQLSNVPHFEIGGSLHLIVNNQVGFTTPSDRGRSTRYCTDLAKMLPVPILHVNGDYPEAVLKATRIAMEYQRKFRKDVFVDMNCFRQWGHNEMDDPTFTNPELYKIIHSRKTVPDRYSEYLIGKGVITKEKVDEIINQHYSWLSDELSTAESYEVDDPCFKNQWQDYNQAQEIITTWDTGVHSGLLSMIGNKSVEYPTDFKIHPHLERTYVKSRLSKIAQGSHIDWATAEALAFGSLLYEGYNVRISGQDVGRGTFSHRHVMLVDQDTNNVHIPLNKIHSQQTGFLEVANSILSEEAVLGFEYGMSVENPKNLIIWEAQFGDFFNGAQIIFDTLISSGEAKWLWSTGIVILLPHGYDGAGPEHSSSRLERFLQMSDSKENEIDSDNVNMEICQPSTPAQYFHLIRRQMVRNFRKPLIIIAPKTLLRLPAATSHIDDMTCGTNFLPVIGETISEYLAVNKIIFCSGKHYYSLKEEQTKSGKKNVALIRIESFCPFPTYQLQEAIQQFPNAKDFLWSQEEPRNMGAWSFLKPRFEHLIGKNLNYCGRDTLPTPAVGVGKWHQEQVKHITTKPFEM